MRKKLPVSLFSVPRAAGLSITSGVRVQGSGFRENFVASFVVSFVDSVTHKLLPSFVPGTPGGGLTYNFKFLASEILENNENIIKWRDFFGVR